MEMDYFCVKYPRPSLSKLKKPLNTIDLFHSLHSLSLFPKERNQSGS